VISEEDREKGGDLDGYKAGYAAQPDNTSPPLQGEINSPGSTRSREDRGEIRGGGREKGQKPQLSHSLSLPASYHWLSVADYVSGEGSPHFLPIRKLRAAHKRNSPVHGGPRHKMQPNQPARYKVKTKTTARTGPDLYVTQNRRYSGYACPQLPCIQQVGCAPSALGSVGRVAVLYLYRYIL
jgi:hypothetical protein